MLKGYSLFCALKSLLVDSGDQMHWKWLNSVGHTQDMSPTCCTITPAFSTSFVWFGCLFLFVCGDFGVASEVLRDYSWRCSKYQIKFRGSNPGQPRSKQVRYYFSGSLLFNNDSYFGGKLVGLQLYMKLWFFFLFQLFVCILECNRFM